MMAAWIWITLGVLLALAEMLVAGFWLLGFAIGAVVTGILIWLEIVASTGWALLIMALVALLAWVVLRRVVGVRKGQTKIWRHDINENHPPRH